MELEDVPLLVCKSMGYIKLFGCETINTPSIIYCTGNRTILYLARITNIYSVSYFSLKKIRFKLPEGLKSVAQVSAHSMPPSLIEVG